MARLPANDLDAAMLLAAERPGELHHAVQSGTWHIWDGRAHMPDRTDAASRMIMGFADRMEYAMAQLRLAVQRGVLLTLPMDAPEAQVLRAIDEALKPSGPAARYCAGLRRQAGKSALLAMLGSLCGVSDTEMDATDPWLLNTVSGTVDLRTGWVKPHDPGDMITYCTPLPYDPAERCPMFWKLVYQVAGENPDVAEYLLKALGYCLIGANPKQLVFFIDGPTRSGKSILMQICREVLGDLAHESQADLITLTRHGRNARTENSIRGKRLVTITETSAFMTIDEGQLKRLTGEAVISVNQHYSKTEIKTPVTFTIFIVTNKMPSLLDYDDAMRRRVSVIPGGNPVPEYAVDESLAERIVATEAAGILALLIRACAEVQRSGLVMPDAVRAKTAEYATVQDTVSNFAAECCVMMPYALGGEVYSIRQSEAWEAYSMWSKGSGRLGRNEFYEHMSRLPGVTRNHDRRRFEGLTFQSHIRLRGTQDRSQDS